MDPLEAVEVEARCFVMRGSKAFPSNLRVKPKPGIVKESVEYTIMTATEPDRKKSLGDRLYRRLQAGRGRHIELRVFI
jgi:hypothetical protein